MATHTSSRSDQSSAMEAMLKGEASKPALAFRLNGHGGLVEGVEIDLEHPALKAGSKGLLVGTHYLLTHRKHGPAFRKMRRPDDSPIGIARRFDIEEISQEGKPPLQLLVQPMNGSNMFVHVFLGVGVNVTKTKALFLIGVEGSAPVVVRKGTEALIRFSEDGQYKNCYYADGAVRRVERQNGVLKLIPLDRAQMGNLWLDRMETMIEDTESETDAIDWLLKCSNALNQIVTIWKLAEKVPTVRARSLAILDTAAREGVLPLKVYENALRAMKLVGDSIARFRLKQAYDEGLEPKQPKNVVVGVKTSATIHAPTPRSTRTKDDTARRNRQLATSTAGPDKGSAAGNQGKPVTNPNSKTARRKLRKAEQRKR